MFITVFLGSISNEYLKNNIVIAIVINLLFLLTLPGANILKERKGKAAITEAF